MRWSNFIKVYISEICTFSISRKVLPDTCKVAKLKPIYKRGKQTDPSSYRPISLISVISKVIERIAYDQKKKKKKKKISQRIIFCMVSNPDIDQVTQKICVRHICRTRHQKDLKKAC